MSDDQSSSSSNSNDANTKLHLRVLIASRYAGGLIGRQGATIANLRAEAGCGIDVSDTVKGATHRIVTLRGQVPSVVKASSALAKQLAIIEADVSNSNSTTTSSSSTPSTNLELVLLVCDTQIGSILGRGGQRISALRSSSGASIRVSDESIDNSNEKTVIIRGNAESINSAISEIANNLIDSAHRALGRTLYVPRGGSEHPSPSPSSSSSSSSSSTRNNVTSVNDSNQPLQTVMVGVPDAMMGGVIGRHGTVIREIRLRSNAQISIGERQPSADGSNTTSQDRIITITGSPSATQIAIAMICERTTQFQQTQTNSTNSTTQQANMTLKNRTA